MKTAIRGLGFARNASLRGHPDKTQQDIRRWSHKLSAEHINETWIRTADCEESELNFTPEMTVESSTPDFNVVALQMSDTENI